VFVHDSRSSHHPYQAIIEAAANEHCDLIVISQLCFEARLTAVYALGGRSANSLPSV
jgi:hypothetical protein